MTPEEELELVKKAILLGRTVTGCFEWHDAVIRRLEKDPELLATKPAAIRQLAIEYAIVGGIISQVKEQRPEYSDYDYYYKMIVPAAEFPQGLFVEMRLDDADIDCPTVLLVTAHPQNK